jgi:predicted transcriptional regulator of viral defense system
VHPILRAVAERQLGLFTAVDARRAGYPPSEIQLLCSNGRWIRLRRGVYTIAEHLAEVEQRGTRHRLECYAVLLDLARPFAAVSHVSAARLWGFPVRRGLDPTVRLTDPGLWRRGHNFHMTRAPLSDHDVTTSGPLRLTSAARTLVDCAREWDVEDAVVAIDAALLAGLTTPEQLVHVAAAQRRWRGVPDAVRAVQLADGRAESALETRGRLRMVGAGLPSPELQVEIRTGGRLVAVVDAWFDDVAVAVEFDGRVKYTDPWRGRSPEQVLWDEKRREDELRALDIGVVRIADADLGHGWPRTEGRLRELLASPGPSLRRFTATPRLRGRQRSG